MTCQQHKISLLAKTRGFHLIDDEIMAQIGAHISAVDCGSLDLFLLHTSASLTINENACSDVRADMEDFFNQAVIENAPYYRHTYEGPDDMPAHIKSSLLGHSLRLPISQGRLALGTWQGIYLGEHRNQAGKRKILASILS